MNKELLRISGIIGLILGILYSTTIIGLIMGIPCIIGSIKMLDYNLKTDKEIIEKKDIIFIWAITFLLLSTISGILLLIFYMQIKDMKIESKKEIVEETKVEKKVTPKKGVKKEVKKTNSKKTSKSKTVKKD